MAVSADTLRLSLVEEITEGVTPTTPTWDLFRTTGEGLTYEVTTNQSEEMGGINRGVKDNILSGATVSGEITFELAKHKAFESLMSSVLGNDWGLDPLLVPGSTSDTAYNASVKRTFTIEKRFTLDDTPTYDYHRFTGCLADVMTIDITPNESITGNFGFVGNEMTTETAEVAGSTYTPAGTEPVMTAPLVTGIELLTPAGIDDTTGLPLGSPVAWSTSSCFTGLTLALNNNSRALSCIGSLGTVENVFGRFEGTANGTLYYAGPQPLDALITQDEFALRVTTSDKNGESYEFLLPRVVFAEASALASGTNTDVMTEFSLVILEYTGDTYAISTNITRSSAA